VKAIGNIYLTWRKGKGSSRKCVGVIKRNSNTAVTFSYIERGVLEAEKEGFTPYVDFPDIAKTYTENVLDIFGQRLIKTERPDSQKYLDFWSIDPKYKDNKYYLLAHTQGLLANDNFEFIADYNPVKGLSFISEICGLSHTNPPIDLISEGDELKWKFNKLNPFDNKSVEVYKGDFRLGNVKLIHCNVFHKPGGKNLKIRVKSIEKNGHLNRVFINVYF